MAGGQANGCGPIGEFSENFILGQRPPILGKYSKIAKIFIFFKFEIFENFTQN